jgi:YD repeat-containing protein
VASTVYDAVNNVVQQIDGLGRPTTFQYDADNRQILKAEVDPKNWTA